MRLKKLKLVGFKSFVDPTNILFPSNLVAVVGPNGCGKSNTIDAVRWVMGESSAKHLRGESMADVIFNGSSNRKPVGQASVELVFDNNEGRLLGEYASYSEIAIKRLVTRDGTSNYYLNGNKCRKKDIVDIFLGTGLGSRSYSIIGQGTISRIIEAKPEELRVFLEEAAGISKYKERRRETENRIRHTRENLERIEDIREELGKQLERLNRQARAAERYKELKEQERETKAQWHALRWQELDKQLQVKDNAIDELRIAQEANASEVTHCDAELEARREHYNKANDEYHEIQGKYYQIGAEIARLEEGIQHQKQRRQQLDGDLQQAKADWESASNHQQNDLLEIETLDEALLELEPLVEESRDSYEQLQQDVAIAEERLSNWQQEWDEFNLVANESSKQAHVEQARIQHLEQQIQAIQTSLERIAKERENLDTQGVTDAIESLSEAKLILDSNQQEVEYSIDEVKDVLSAKRQQIAELDNEWQEARESCQKLKARLTSLEALQLAALGKQNNQVNKWLESNQLHEKPRLAQHLEVEPGWDSAVEMVLGDYLQAVCVDDCNSVSDLLNGFAQGEICFLDASSQALSGVVAPLPSLATKITTKWQNSANLLAGIYAAKDLSQAIEWLGQIASHESIVTKQGLWLGHGWLRVKKESDDNENILQREREIRALTAEVESQQQTVEETHAQLEQAKEQLADKEIEREELAERLAQVKAENSDCQAKLRVKKAQLEQVQQRYNSLENDTIENHSKLESCQHELREARQTWQEAMNTMDGDSERREQLTAAREEINYQLDEARERSLQLRELLHDKELSLKTKQSQRNQLQERCQREQGRIQSLSLRIEQITQALTACDNPGEDITERLEEKLSLHVELEEQLNKAKVTLDEINHAITQLDKKRHETEEKSRNLQAKLDQIRMDAQTLRVRCTTVIESLDETDYSLKELLENMPEEAEEKEWERRLSDLSQKIQRLGAINLAAIDEYKTESERKRYLDEQHQDLVDALQTLENAIQKIDKETRQRFKQTYDQVNEGFKKLFPRLFGGGHAYLELTGDDLLDTGVTVMARPPGKRNSSIHLLSGGEKAMAAVGLVFSIFQLNPSPFCMLDEVDAPLDDANVARFCAMVKEMSENVQFIFITHNKLTMELATHLSGVTMHEPGVSRIVSVDIDEAMAIAE